LPTPELAHEGDGSDAELSVASVSQNVMGSAELEDIYENAPCGYILLRADGTIVQANHLFLKMAGLSRDAAIGINFRKLLTSAGAIYYDTQILPPLLLSGIRNEIAFDLVRADGQRLPVLVNVSLRRDPAGQPCEIRMILMQASERRQYERELLRSRKEAEQMAEVVFHSSDAIIALRPDGHVKNWNRGAAEMFGYAAHEAIGKPFFKLISLEEEPAGTLDALHHGQNIHIETAGHHRSGRRVDLSVSLTPHLEAPGTLVAFSAIVRDITLQKLAERALLQSEKLASVGRLASSIAHEINNPLEAITNLLFILDLKATTSELKGLIRTAQEELARVSQITTHTLRFHRQSSKPTEVDVKQLLESVLLLYRPRLQNSSIEGRVDRSDACLLLSREGELRQVILNLVGNAVDAMKTGGRLLLRCREATGLKNGGKGVRITIADTGTGMDQQTLKRIFEPFFTTKGIGGTGLGLWVTLDLVHKSLGSIRVRSSNRGSVFALYFPH
jgi:PAS domain S-box-containing protein